MSFMINVYKIRKQIKRYNFDHCALGEFHFNKLLKKSLLTGKIVLYDDPSTVVTEFTQEQIDHAKIAYRPPKVELGMIARVFQFKFSIVDDEDNTLPNQVL